jgi:hypothetical protein
VRAEAPLWKGRVLTLVSGRVLGKALKLGVWGTAQKRLTRWSSYKFLRDAHLPSPKQYRLGTPDVSRFRGFLVHNCYDLLSCSPPAGALHARSCPDRRGVGSAARISICVTASCVSSIGWKIMP